MLVCIFVRGNLTGFSCSVFFRCMTAQKHHRCQNGVIMETNSTSPVKTPLTYFLLKTTACCLLQLALNNLLNFHCVWDSFMSSQISVLRFSTFYPGHIYLITTTSCCEVELRGTICLCAVKTLNTDCTSLRALTCLRTKPPLRKLWLLFLQCNLGKKMLVSHCLIYWTYYILPPAAK